jgi:hypothetical protein
MVDLIKRLRAIAFELDGWNQGRLYKICNEAATALERQDRLPVGHTILEQACMKDGRVSQTVRYPSGDEYERIVTADEAYGEELKL